MIHARNVPRRHITCLDKAKPAIAGAHAIKNQSANVSFFFFSFFSMNSFVRNRGTIVPWNENYRDTSLFFPRVRCSFLFESFLIVLSTLTTGIRGDRRGTVHSIFHQLSLTIKIPCATSILHAVVTSSKLCIVNGNRPGYPDELSAVEICLYEFGR